MVRNVVIGMLFVTVIAPIVLYTDRLGTFHSFSSSCKYFYFNFLGFFFRVASLVNLIWVRFVAASNEFVEDVTTFVSAIFLIFAFPFIFW